MKLYVSIKNEKQKIETIGGNESLTFEINRGNRRMIEIFLTIELLTNSKELMVVDMLNLSDGSTTRIFEYEVNNKLPEHKTSKKQKGYKHDCGYPQGRVTCNCL